MGRSPCCEKAHTNKCAWTKEEDQRLSHYIRIHGEGCWRSIPKDAGLLRCGKSCRLRWINYLRPDLKRGNFTEQEDEMIIKLHSLLGNKWSLIAARLPGRTDNEIKNYWNTHIKRKLLSRGVDPQTHRPLNQHTATATATELDFRNVPKAESLEKGNSNSSGMTTDEEQQPFPSSGQDLNLELSIGISSFGRKNNSTANFADSKPWLGNMNSQFPEHASICLCCQLGFQGSELCRNCQNSHGFTHY